MLRIPQENSQSFAPARHFSHPGWQRWFITSYSGIADGASMPDIHVPGGAGVMGDLSDLSDLSGETVSMGASFTNIPVEVDTPPNLEKPPGAVEKEPNPAGDVGDYFSVDPESSSATHQIPGDSPDSARADQLMRLNLNRSPIRPLFLLPGPSTPLPGAGTRHLSS